MSSLSGRRGVPGPSGILGVLMTPSMTRRRWIAAGTAAAAASALPAAPPGTRTQGAAPAPPLPTPFSPDVFRERQSRLRAAARAQGVDALFVTPSTNLAYSANLSIFRSERLTTLLLMTDGPAVLVTPLFEADNHRRDAVVDDVVTWREDEDPFATAAKSLGRIKTLGIEGSTAWDTGSRIVAASGAAPRDAGPIFDGQRTVKTDAEQEMIRDAARRTIAAIEATHKRLERGLTENAVSDMLEQEFRKLGVKGGGLVQFGPSAALPHGGPGDRKLAAGDVVLIDAGCKVRGYNSDVTRSVAFGAPSDELRKVYATVDRAQRAGIDALRAGAAGQDVDRAARRVIEEAGYGQYFTHRLGHGLGMDGHEAPYLVGGNEAPLAAGNVVTIEPGIYVPGRLGVRIEDDYAVRSGAPAGALSARPGELTVLNG
ncbi:MAG TPA: Xaa-Pro peptidase family protein [Thermoanaerobaculia bacterium]|jgi:Xaa-Pro dipeptidase|nr:Xaa-Pro peptidase family protein [Thermoanaerobaculia bacterium]